jgi:plasmid stabilization system protein ParE
VRVPGKRPANGSVLVCEAPRACTGRVADLKQAIDWYRDQRPGLDDELSAKFELILSSILKNPRAFPVLHLGVRRAVSNRFPYSVIFDVREDMIVVLAVRHHSRRPVHWLEGQ